MIKVFIGPMYSGKSEQLISNYNKIWNKTNIMCFKPAMDDRDKGVIKSRNCGSIEAICIDKFEDIKKQLKKNIKTIFIDEAEFLLGNPKIIFELSLNNGIDFYIAGLSLTAEQKPFGKMPEILSYANEIVFVPAVCFDCNKPAVYSFFTGDKKQDILIGSEGYIPLCENCLIKRKRPSKVS